MAMRKFLEPDPVYTGVGKWRIALFDALFFYGETVLFYLDNFKKVYVMYIAITPYRTLTQDDLRHFLAIAPAIDHLIFRTPMQQADLKRFLERLLQAGFPKSKITVHSDMELLQKLDLRTIHFREHDERAFQFKAAHPQIMVSMSTHSSASAQAAEAYHLDYVLFGHLFSTKSKPGKAPRTQAEIAAVLRVGIPVVALGGINAETLGQVPSGFAGIAAISYFMENDLVTLCSAKEAE